MADIEFRRGDLFESGAEALVNPVNCVGAMGRGLALSFRLAYPENYVEYRAVCRAGGLRPGKLLIHERTGSPRYIINFPTKRHWRGRSLPQDIDAGLASLVSAIRERQIGSIAIPPLGCGLGGLKWDDVRERIVRSMSELEGVKVFLYEPTTP